MKRKRSNSHHLASTWIIIASTWIVIVLLIAACSSNSDTGTHELTSAEFDPTSTRDLQGPGGASIEPIPLDDLADLSDAAVEMTVLDVRPSRLNTPNGEFPAVDVEGPAGQLSDLLVFTEIEVRVEVVHALRAGLEDNISAGDILVVTVDGGLIETVLPAAEAAALGIRMPVNEPEGSTEDPAPGSPERDPVTPTESVSDGKEIVPAEPVPYARGIPPFYSLTEGDRVLVFLVYTTQPGFRGPDIDVLEPTHPYGLFRQSGDKWIPDREAAEGVDPIALAKGMDQAPRN